MTQPSVRRRTWEEIRAAPVTLPTSIGAGLDRRLPQVFRNLKFAVGLWWMFHHMPPGWRRGLGRVTFGQLGKDVGRTLIPILALGIGLGMGIGAITEGPGSLVSSILATQDAVPLILRVALPLALTVFFAARTGGTLAAKFATAARDAGREGRPHDWMRRSLPHLLVALPMGAFSYLLTAELLVRGYETAGRFTDFWTLDGVKLVGWEEPVVPGLIAAVILSYAVSHISIAYGAAHGTRGSEDGRRRERMDKPDHYVVWQSFRASVFVGVVLTFVVA